MPSGGVQRAATNLANKWADQGHQVFLLSFESKDSKNFYTVSEKVRPIKMGDPRKNSRSNCAKIFFSFLTILKVRSQLKHLLKLCRKKPIMIMFLPHICVYGRFASLGLNLFCISSDRLYAANEFSNKLFLWKWAHHLAYYLSNRVTTLTESMKQYYSPRIQKKISVIPNFVTHPEKKTQECNIPKPFILSVGRLERQKRFDLVIEAFCKLQSEHPVWSLVIAGQGSLLSELQSQAKGLKLSEKVFFLGQTNELSSLYSHAEFLMMASDFEGFPNVLCEAMSYGLPAVFTDCPGGPADIIKNNEDGLLVKTNSSNALVEASRQLVEDESKRKQMGQRARKNIERFYWSRVSPQWEQLFDSLESKAP